MEPTFASKKTVGYVTRRCTYCQRPRKQDRIFCDAVPGFFAQEGTDGVEDLFYRVQPWVCVHIWLAYHFSRAQTLRIVQPCNRQDNTPPQTNVLFDLFDNAEGVNAERGVLRNSLNEIFPNPSFSFREPLMLERNSSRKITAGGVLSCVFYTVHIRKIIMDPHLPTLAVQSLQSRTDFCETCMVVKQSYRLYLPAGRPNCCYPSYRTNNTCRST